MEKSSKILPYVTQFQAFPLFRTTQLLDNSCQDYHHARFEITFCTIMRA